MVVSVQRAAPDIPPHALADLLWGTDPKLNAYMFRTRETLYRILQGEWPADRGMLCHRHALTVTDGAVLSGLLVGHTAQDWPENFEASLDIQTRSLTEAEAVYLADAIYWMDRLFPTPRERSYYVLELATAPQAQGQGLASHLLDAAMARAREKGCGSICLDVAADNEAVGFYRHKGFHVEIETRVPYLADTHGIGRHLHMVRALDAVS